MATYTITLNDGTVHALHADGCEKQSGGELGPCYWFTTRGPNSVGVGVIELVIPVSWVKSVESDDG